MISQTKPSGEFQIPSTPDTQAQAAPTKPKITDLDQRPKLDQHTRMLLIQAINAEFARTRKTFPLGYKEVTLTTDGKLKPEDTRLYQLAITNGAAARVGDRIQITNVSIRDKSIYLEINGGPKKKTKWYQHISVSGLGGTAAAPGPDQTRPTGAAITLEFKNYVPELTGPELKQLLDPVFDFSVKSAAEVYLETVPPKVKEAIKNHEVLVGMNHDMVIMAKDRPPQKLREKDEKGAEYEEWIYGKPPQDVTFVRFVGDEVTWVETIKVDGNKIVKTEKEVDVKDGVVSMASATAHAAAAANNEEPVSDKPAGNKPSLKRPGEADDPMVHQPNDGGPTTQRPVDPTGMPPSQPPIQTNPPTRPPD
ncbi:MAG TPA: hypothetical protein VKD65_05690 [Candidatus Angelobacter sp.]|nr:hypothetical protein [Candidatus Angelobacter sp.]